MSHKIDGNNKSTPDLIHTAAQQPKLKKRRIEIDTDASSTCGISSLPYEITTHIFSFLSPSDLVEKVPLVCKEWRGLSEDFQVWQNVWARAFPDTKTATPRKTYQDLCILSSNISKGNYTEFQLEEAFGSFECFVYGDGKLMTLSRLKTGQEKATDRAFSEENNYSMDCSDSEGISHLWRIWDLKTMTLQSSIPAHADSPDVFACGAGKFFILNPDDCREVDVFDLSTQERINTLKSPWGEVDMKINQLSYMDGRLVVESICALDEFDEENNWYLDTGERTGFAIWDTNTGECIASKSWEFGYRQQPEVLHFCSISDGKLMVFLGDIKSTEDDYQVNPSMNIEIWDLSSGKRLMEVGCKQTIEESNIILCCFGDKVFYYDSEENKINICDVNTSDYLGSISDACSGLFSTFEFIHCTGSMLFIGYDNKVNIFDVETGMLLQNLEDEDSNSHVKFSYVDKYSLILQTSSVFNKHFFKIWDLNTGMFIKAISREDTSPLYADGKFIYMNNVDFRLIEILNFNSVEIK